jgi:hypothetical protein
MVQPADSLLRKDLTRSYGTSPVRCSLLKSEMRAVLVMETNILGEQSLQMTFIVFLSSFFPVRNSREFCKRKCSNSPKPNKELQVKLPYPFATEDKDSNRYLNREDRGEHDV